MEGSWVWLGLYQWPHLQVWQVADTSGAMEVTKPCMCLSSFSRLTQLAQYHFYHILLVKASHTAMPDSGMGGASETVAIFAISHSNLIVQPP